MVYVGLLVGWMDGWCSVGSGGFGGLICAFSFQSKRTNERTKKKERKNEQTNMEISLVVRLKQLLLNGNLV